MTLSLALQGLLALLGTHVQLSPEVSPGVGLEVQEGGTAPAIAAAPDELDQLTVYLGQRMFDEDFWAPLEDQLTFGLEFSQERSSQMIGWEAGLMYSYDEDEFGGFDIEASSLEFYGGLHKTFLDPASPLRPYFGGGLAWITGEFEASGLGSDDDSSIGLYAHGGLRGRITESFFLGADLRLLLGTDVEIAGVEGDGDYVQFALSASWLL